MGPLPEPRAQTEEVLRQATAAGVAVTAIVGEAHRIGSLSWRVLWPRRIIATDESVPNNASVVLLVEQSGVRLLLAGDIEPAAQRALLGAGDENLRVDVLKVPHHGSRYQEPAFFAAVAPRVAITSVGADNDYGHPSAATEHHQQPWRPSPAHRPRRRCRRRRDSETLRVVARGGTGDASPRRLWGTSRLRRPPSPRATPPPCQWVRDRSVAMTAPVTLVVGPEELLAERAVSGLVAAARTTDPDVIVHDIPATEISAGRLAELVSPSLFGGTIVVVVRGAQDLSADVAKEFIAYLAAPRRTSPSFSRAQGGGAKGKAVLRGGSARERDVDRVC